MRQAVFQYKIYRHKFLATFFLVAAVSLILYGALCLIFLRGWLDEQRQAAELSFAETDSQVKAAASQASEYILRMYSDNRIMQDAADLFTASTEEEYLRAREKRSQQERELIQYFPGSLRTLIAGRSGQISGITLVSETGIKAITYNRISGEVVTWYGLTEERDAALHQGFGNLLIAAYPLHDPGTLSRQVGTIHFFASSQNILRMARAEAGACAIVDKNGLAGGTGFVGNRSAGEAETEWLLKAASFSENEGSFPDGSFNKVFYTRSAASLPGAQYVSVVDIATLAGQNAVTLIGLLLAFLLLDAVILFWTVHGIRYDAGFLGYILGMISSVEKGDFASAEALVPPVSARKNEYEMIASAVKNMSSTLDVFIRKEYRLKLKQQETAMRALQNQINPHFLYNTLEMIRAQALVHGDNTAADAIALLGSIYRDVVRGGSVISLRDEFDLLDTYLQIMALRWPQSLSYQIELEPEMDSLETIKFWLQPLAENFFTHGFDRSSEYNLLIATGYAEENGWRIELIDNGSGIPVDEVGKLNAFMRIGADEQGGSIGLRNVYERLAFFYGQGFTMEIRNNAEGGACVSIHIPRKEEAECTP